MRLLFYVAAITMLAACGSPKLSAEDEKRNDLMAQKMEDAGFEKGMIVKGSGQDETCKFVLQLEEDNIVELAEIPEDFQKDKLDVWVKWAPHRRPSLCGFQTGAIVEIQFR